MILNCPTCGKTLSVPDSAAGKRARCPGCAEIMSIPLAVPADQEYQLSSLPQSSFAAGSSFSGGASWQNDAGGFSRPPAAVPIPDGGQARRSCPQCSELIFAAAAKCGYCGAIFDPRLRARQAFRGSPAGSAVRGKKIRRYFKLWWINALFGVVSGVAMIAAVAVNPNLFVISFPVIVMMSLPLVVIGAVAYYKLLYQLWATVQDGRAQTTPGSAVGFLFIPCFNLYWQFVAFWGLSKDLNRVSREYNIPAPPANEKRALAVCILHCSSYTPIRFLDFLMAPACIIITFVEMKNMCDTAIAINEGLSA